MDTPSSVSAQEKLSAALGSVIFFLPILTNVKTGYVVKYMKQGFFINLVQVLLSVVSMFLWFLAPLTGLINFVLFLMSLYIAFRAYSGKDYAVAFFAENAEMIIQKM
jgi:uncharacterized membrane protein